MCTLNLRTINAIHFLAIGPFLAYIGYIGLQGQAIPEFVWQALLVIGVIATAYHFFRYNSRVEGMIVSKEKIDETYNEGFTSVAEPSEAKPDAEGMYW